MTHGQEYDRLIKTAEEELKRVDPTAYGDLWAARIHLRKAITALDQADELLLKVSKTAFERVFKEKNAS